MDLTHQRGEVEDMVGDLSAIQRRRGQSRDTYLEVVNVYMECNAFKLDAIPKSGTQGSLEFDRQGRGRKAN